MWYMYTPPARTMSDSVAVFWLTKHPPVDGSFMDNPVYVLTDVIHVSHERVMGSGRRFQARVWEEAEAV